MEIVLYDKIENPIEAIEKMGSFFAKSGMFGCDRLEQGQVLAAACMAERKSPLEITRKYHLLDGRLSMKSEAMLAEFRGRGGKQEIVTRTPDCAAIRLTIDGQSQVFSLTWDEAKEEPFPYGKENKLKKNWATPRARMQTMWARVVSDGVRAMAPEIVTGTYTPEEIEDFDGTIPPQTKPLVTKTPEPPKSANVEAPPPAPKPPTAPSPSQPIDVEFKETVTRAEVDANGKLTIGTIAALQGILSEHEVQAFEWLKAKNYLNEPKQSFSDMQQKVAQKILDAPAKFIEAITPKENAK